MIAGKAIGTESTGSRDALYLFTSAASALRSITQSASAIATDVFFLDGLQTLGKVSQAATAQVTQVLDSSISQTLGRVGQTANAVLRDRVASTSAQTLGRVTQVASVIAYSGAALISLSGSQTLARISQVAIAEVTPVGYASMAQTLGRVTQALVGQVASISGVEITQTLPSVIQTVISSVEGIAISSITQTLGRIEQFISSNVQEGIEYLYADIYQTLGSVSQIARNVFYSEIAIRESDVVTLYIGDYGVASNESSVSIHKGSTGPLVEVYAKAMTSVEGWVCSIQLFDSAGNSTLSRNVYDYNPDGDRFVAYLTDAETQSLDVDLYTWVITLSNTLMLPPFKAQDIVYVAIEPPKFALRNQVVIKGVNSFGTWQELVEQLSAMPTLTAATAASRVDLRSMAIQAWSNVGGLNVDFENDLQSTMDFSEEVILALTATQQKQLIQAQLIEADFLLGGNPIEMRRRMGLMSDSAGESAHFMRPTKPVVLPVCRDAAFALTPYVSYSAWAGR